MKPLIDGKLDRTVLMLLRPFISSLPLLYLNIKQGRGSLVGVGPFYHDLLSLRLPTLTAMPVINYSSGPHARRVRFLQFCVILTVLFHLYSKLLGSVCMC